MKREKNDVDDIIIRNVSHHYHTAENGTLDVLRDINITVGRGEICAIVGPSGCGKTTLLEIALGLKKPTSGNATLAERNDDGTPRGVAVVHQEARLFPWRTVFQNACVGAEVRGFLTRSVRDDVRNTLRSFDLLEFVDYMPEQISGGMRQRVAVVRALAAQPKILVCDEPFSAIDFVVRLHLSTEFRRRCNQDGISVLMVTHDIDDAIFLADKIYVLYGRPAVINEDKIFRPQFVRRTAAESRASKPHREMFEQIWRALGERE